MLTNGSTTANERRAKDARAVEEATFIMCGIAGFVCSAGTHAGTLQQIRRMTDALAHRGPDDQGYHIDHRVALGHRRLSIIDLASGQQPIYNEDRSVCVVFNGEIYNYKEVRRDLLSAGHVFVTNSDTETVVHAYEAWGERCVERFRGMFAFAVRDIPNDSLFLARDRFGKKPLFYSVSSGGFRFASEMKAILSDPAFDRQIDEEAVASYFTYSYIPAPLTIFKGIRKLMPGHTLVLKGDDLRARQYWDLSVRPNRERSERSFIEEFRERMAEATSIRLMSEVPLGAFLSGGVDSSTVVAYMAMASPDPVNTFTIGFSGDTGFFEDEREYARLVASRYRTNHREFEVRPKIDGLVEKIVRSFDEPFADDSTIPSYFVYKMAREEVTVALSGLGGDEAFCGYERYLGFHLGRWFDRVPRSIGRVLATLVDRLPEPRSGGYRVNHLKRFVRSAEADGGHRYLGYVQKMAPAYRGSLFSAENKAFGQSVEAAEDRLIRCYTQADAEDALGKVLYCDVKMYLPDDILACTDRLSMCHSLEVRVPFLDHPLFEFAATIPSEMKIRHLQKKYLLKRAVAPLVPNEVLSHKKQGFVAPLPRWLRAELKPFVTNALSARRLSRHGIFNDRTVRAILADHFESRETNDTLIWALVVFQAWYDLYVERTPTLDWEGPCVARPGDNGAVCRS